MHMPCRQKCRDQEDYLTPCTNTDGDKQRIIYKMNYVKVGIRHNFSACLHLHLKEGREVRDTSMEMEWHGCITNIPILA